MQLNEIIDDIASQADDFLADTHNKDQARASIAELLNSDYANLSSADKKRVAENVMRILEDEGFFDSRYASEADGDDDNDNEDDETGGND